MRWDTPLAVVLAGALVGVSFMLTAHLYAPRYEIARITEHSVARLDLITGEMDYCFAMPHSDDGAVRFEIECSGYPQ
jgi:hypothetical protein